MLVWVCAYVCVCMLACWCVQYVCVVWSPACNHDISREEALTDIQYLACRCFHLYCCLIKFLNNTHYNVQYNWLIKYCSCYFIKTTIHVYTLVYTCIVQHIDTGQCNNIGILVMYVLTTETQAIMYHYCTCYWGSHP